MTAPDIAAPPAGGATRTRLDPNLIAAEVDGGRIAENILYFGRLLRASGLPVGPEKIVLATRAVLAAGIEDPKILYWTLHAVFVNRRAEHELFNQAFLMFWKDPGYLEQMMALMLPQMKVERQADDNALSRRLAESLFKAHEDKTPREEQVEIDAVGTFSDLDAMREKDFEQMSAAELALARRAIADMSLVSDPVRTRRFEPARRGERIDLRRMLRETASKGGDSLMPAYKRRRWRRPPLVVLCDISGSMDTYARVFLHFLYALTNDRDRVSAFLFGTRLSNVTRELRNRDPDAAIAKVSHGVNDWSGGTRIGATLEEFNRRWARRVLGQNATVLLFTDGLDRDGAEGIERAARRLGASARRFVWLNPLLRWEGYEPLASGAKALSRHVTEVRACHNLKSLADLKIALDRPPRN
jgi:uncharacterized protein with von Willebrand factor type A (vWA) domain